MQEAARLVVGRLAAGDGEQFFLPLYFELFGAEARDGDVDAIGVLVGPFDIVGGIAGGGVRRGGFQEISQAVEANDGPIKRGEVDRTHCVLLSKQGCVSDWMTRTGLAP